MKQLRHGLQDVLGLLERSLLTEIKVHQLLRDSPVQHPGRNFILKLLDCQMFPPYPTTVALVRQAERRDGGGYVYDAISGQSGPSLGTPSSCYLEATRGTLLSRTLLSRG